MLVPARPRGFSRGLFLLSPRFLSPSLFLLALLSLPGIGLWLPLAGLPWPLGLGGCYRPGGGFLPSCGVGCAVPGVFVSFVLCVLVGGPECFVCPFHVPPPVGRMIGGGSMAARRSSAQLLAPVSPEAGSSPPAIVSPFLVLRVRLVSLVVCLSGWVRGFGVLPSWFLPDLSALCRRHP